MYYSVYILQVFNFDNIVIDSDLEMLIFVD